MNRHNLERLAAYLDTLPTNYLHFDMESYYHDPRVNFLSEYEEMVSSIDLAYDPVDGMCGCILGHSAAAGIMTANHIQNCKNWFDFAVVAYGVNEEQAKALFAGELYSDIDTPQKAAEHIRAIMAVSSEPEFA